MTFAALDGLDAIDWNSVHHAYGEAGDVPRLLRQAVGPDDGAAGEALEELASSITHQGTLYTATPVAVPFLIALAGEPEAPRRRRLLWQLCMIAESRDAGPEVLEAVRDALGAGAEQLVALLDDPDADVRQAAGFVVGHLPAGHVPLDALRRRREAEDDGSVAAGLLAAAARLYPQDAVEWLREELAPDRPDVVRAGAAWTLARFAGAWSPAASAAVLDCWADGAPFGHSEWTQEPLGEIVEALPHDTAAGLVGALLERGAAKAVQEAVYAVHQRCVWSRSARDAFAGVLARAVSHDDPDVRNTAAEAVKEVRAAIPEAVDPLAEYVNAPPKEALAERWSPEGRLFASALEVLVTAGDDRWRGPLRAALGRGWFDAGVLALLIDQETGYDAVLLAVLRPRIAGDEVPARMWNDPGVIVPRLLAVWGADAAEAVPELTSLARQGSVWAITALRAMGGAASAAVPTLLGVSGTAAMPTADQGDRPWGLRVAAAEALAVITGDAAHLTRIVAAAAEAGEVLVAVRTAAAHGMPLDGLVPALREIARLDAEGFRAREERIEAAGLLLDATGETEVPLLAAGRVLARGQQVAERAAELAGRLGPAAAELAPALRGQARDPYFGFGAALALRRIDGSTGPLLDAVRARLERLGPGPWLPEAVEALGAAAAGLLPELDALVEGDRSAVGIGTAGTMIEADDRLREMLAGVRSRLAP